MSSAITQGAALGLSTRHGFRFSYLVSEKRSDLSSVNAVLLADRGELLALPEEGENGSAGLSALRNLSCPVGNFRRCRLSIHEGRVQALYIFLIGRLKSFKLGGCEELAGCAASRLLEVSQS